MVIFFALVGAAVGLGSNVLLGLIAGAAIGYLVTRLSEVHRAVERLQSTLDAQRRSHPEYESATPVLQETPAPVPRPSPPAETTTRRREPFSPAQVTPAASAMPPPASRRASPLRPAASRSAPQPDLLDMLWRAGRRWLTTGNVPVKVGVIISFFGVAFLLKYAVDRSLFVVPMELRLLGVAAVGGVLLAIGWRLRRRRAVYALSLQGGGIGILYLTIFSAFRLYALLPSAPAFGLLVVITAAAGALAVLQNAPALAILASVGGFLSPVLVSTGQGSHVALFSYYLVLNCAILGISWYRAWQGLNLVGFVFTFGVGTLWGYEYYRPELYASTQPFLVLNFFFYQAIAVLFAFRRVPRLRGMVDGTIVFGTPVIAFALQAQLVGESEYDLAISAVAVAMFYAALAGWLNRRYREQFWLLVDSYAALGVAFATIAIPLALSARWTAASWALEGAALVWIGVRQQGLLARLSGAVLLVAGGLAFLEDGWRSGIDMPVLNGNVLGGFLISAASLFAAYRLHTDRQPHHGQKDIAVGLMVWGLAWWLGTGTLEIEDRVTWPANLHGYVLFFAASAMALAWSARRLRWASAGQATLAYLPLLVLPMAAWYLVEHGHLFTGAGWLAWPVALAAHFGVLWLSEQEHPAVAAAWHPAGALLLTAAIGIEAYWRIDEAGLNDTWAEGAALLAILLPAGLILVLRERLAWPLQQHWNGYVAAGGAMVVLQLLLLLAAGIDHPGSPAPLPYLPVLNPFDVLTVVGLAFAMRFLLRTRDHTELFEAGRWASFGNLWAAATFLLTTVAVVRGVHHLAGVAWSGGALARSVSVQAALSIYWGMLGFAGMVFGARRTRRNVWLAGAALMALVVFKLFLVDLGNTGTVARIVSFLGVGGLLLVVGWFAPAPPKLESAHQRGARA